MNTPTMVWKQRNIAVLTCCLLLTAGLAFIADHALASEEAVVTVNGKSLTQKELDTKADKLLETTKSMLPQKNVNMDTVKKNIRKGIIQDFITRTLLEQEATKKNIVVSEQEIDNTINQYKERMPKGVNLEDALKKGGMSLEDMRKSISYTLQIDKLVASQIAGYTPSRQEIEEYYKKNAEKFNTPEKVHARHILVKTDTKDDEGTKQEKKKKIESLRARLVKGEDFEKLAKENSDCPSSQKGGDLGTFSRGRMVKPFEEAAFGQKENEIGPIVETRFGYHIVQVLEHSQPKQGTLEDASPKITQLLKQKKAQQIKKDYLAKLRKDAEIVYANPEDAAKK